MSDREYCVLGTGFDRRPLLRQLGPGSREIWPLRFCTVQASSESAAKRIQVAWRKDQKADS